MYQEQENIHPDRKARSHQRERDRTVNVRDSVLHTEWVEPDRPYSQKELQYLDDKLATDLQIDDLYVKHKDCEHCYRVKKNGIRYKKLLEYNESTSENPEEIPDIGNCSVCWKIRKTPRELHSLVYEFISFHNNELENSRKSYSSYLIKYVFYTWLYNESYN
jgi:hypothetical protein